MRSIDTNVLVRLIVGDDLHQATQGRKFIEAAGAWVSQLVLAETVWVLSSSYQMPAADLAKVIDMLLSHQDIALQDPDTVGAALELFRERPSQGFTDCLVLEIARKVGHLPLGTYDRVLGRRPGAQRI